MNNGVIVRCDYLPPFSCIIKQKEFIMPKLNPDIEIVKDIRQRLKDNKGYCPCMLEKSPDTKCPCKDFRESKICHCGLYVKE